MLIKAGLLFLGFCLGYTICCLMTTSKMCSIKEEAEEYIEYMRQIYEERYKGK